MDITNLARETCIADPALLWAIIAGNVAVFIAYVWIPVSLLRMLAKEERIPQPVLLLLFSAFILLCGLTHLVGFVVIFRPYYGLEAGMLGLTALVSLLTGAVLHRAVGAIRQAVTEYHAMVDLVRVLTADLARERAAPKEQGA